MLHSVSSPGHYKVSKTPYEVHRSKTRNMVSNNRMYCRKSTRLPIWSPTTQYLVTPRSGAQLRQLSSNNSATRRKAKKKKKTTNCRHQTANGCLPSGPCSKKVHKQTQGWRTLHVVYHINSTNQAIVASGGVIYKLTLLPVVRTTGYLRHSDAG